MKEEIKIGVILKKIHNVFENGCNKELKKLDITSSQHNVLMYLLINQKNGNEVNQKDIENRFGLTNPTVTGILNRLESKLFITRKVSQKDGRYKEIRVTNKAMDMANEMLNKGKKLEEKLTSGMSKDDVNKLKEYLETMLNNISSSSENI